MDKTDNIEIKNSFIARAGVRGGYILLAWKVYSSALMALMVLAQFSSFALAKPKSMAVNQSSVVRFEDLKKTKAIEVRRTNPRTGAYELLRLDKKGFTLRWSKGGVERNIPLPPEALTAMDQALRSLGEIPNKAVGREADVRVILSVVSKRETRSVNLDPEGPLKSVYVEFMARRNEALAHDK